MREDDLKQRNVIYGLYCDCPKCAPESRIRYVGLTTQSAEDRLSDHLKPYRAKYPYPVDRWKFKHGVENIRMKVLEVVPDDVDIFEREVYWVDVYKTFTDDKQGGLNRTRGGRTAASEYSRAAIREANSRDTVSWAKVGSQKASEIRELFNSGVPTKDISEQYGIRQGHVTDIVHNRVWFDPNYEYTPRTRVVKAKPEHPSWAISKGDAYQLRREYAEEPDATWGGMAEKYGVSLGCVRNVVFNTVWVDPGYEYTPKAIPDARKAAISKSLKGRSKPEGHGLNVSLAIRGEGHGMGKLKEADVVRIRELARSGIRQKDIAEQYGIKQTQVSRIVRGVRWGHVKEGLE